jgi:membrane protein implicated in regulation of membrane protease activity
MIIYTACLALGLLFTIISAVAGHFFGGHEVAGHIEVGGHAGAGLNQGGVPGMSFLSPTVLACFVTAFGACGLILSRVAAAWGVWITAPISAVAGLAMALAAFVLFNFIFSHTQGSSEAHVAALVGHIASIVTPIPRKGVGEIAYVQGGSRYTAPARAENGQPVQAGKEVRITRIVGTEFFVDIAY